MTLVTVNHDVGRDAYEWQPKDLREAPEIDLSPTMPSKAPKVLPDNLRGSQRITWPLTRVTPLHCHPSARPRIPK